MSKNKSTKKERPMCIVAKTSYKKMFKRIKKYLRNNIILADFWDSVHSKTIKKSIVIKKYIRKLIKTDSILDFESFQSIIKDLLSKEYNKYINQTRYECTKYYGYYNEILKYSGYPQKPYPIITQIEHGIRFGKADWLYDERNTCYICQGEKRISEIINKNPEMPILSIGPYIYYSEQYYDENTLSEIKKKYGKTLLVFLGHTTEWEKEKKENNIIDIIYERYAPNYNTILVCLYWRDVNCIEGEEFKKRGAKLVSAGFRQDPNFIKRLKSIISLSDMVLANDIGTNIGFALSMNKPVVLLGKGDINTGDDVFDENYRLFYKAFSLSKDGCFSKEQILLQNSLYKSFWGGDKTLSKKEMYVLFSLINKVLKHVWWDPVLFQKAISNNNKLQKILDTDELKMLMRIKNAKLIL